VSSHPKKSFGFGVGDSTAVLEMLERMARETQKYHEAPCNFQKLITSRAWAHEKYLGILSQVLQIQADPARSTQLGNRETPCCILIAGLPPRSSNSLPANHLSLTGSHSINPRTTLTTGHSLDAAVTSAQASAGVLVGLGSSLVEKYLSFR